MRTLSTFAAAALLAAAAWTAAADEPEPKTKLNTPPEGFTALFNGKDLSGWQIAVDMRERKKLSKEQYAKVVKERNEKLLSHWKVKDGVIEYDGKGNSLQTVKDYGDFELYVDWKIEPKGDSGIYLRGQPQVQIWDSDVLAGNLKEDKGLGSGGLWNNPKNSKGQKPLKKADRPVGQWNTFHIIMRGDKVTVNLNGVKVVDEAPLANYWERGRGVRGKRSFSPCEPSGGAE